MMTQQTITRVQCIFSVTKGTLTIADTSNVHLPQEMELMTQQWSLQFLDQILIQHWRPALANQHLIQIIRMDLQTH